MHAQPMLTFPVQPPDIHPCATSLWPPAFSRSLQCRPLHTCRECNTPPWLASPSSRDLHFGQNGMEGLPDLKTTFMSNVLQTRLTCSQILTDFQWWCPGCLHVPSGVFGKGADEGTGVFVLPQDFGEMVFFFRFCS